jgi:uncharacterized protein (DUF427 family)
MSLTLGSGPFGQAPRGTFNEAVSIDGQVIWWEDSPRWVRGKLDREVVVDSRRVKLLHESGLMLRWYFPLEDVRQDVLEASERHTYCPIKGQASYFGLRVGDRAVENAAWTYPEPIEGAPPLAGYLSFYWEKLDEWWEEDERVYVHPRDPYHRVDVLRTSRRVQVSVNGRELADTTRALVLFESSLPPRWYLPREDVRPELLREVENTTRCPYKGIASYYAVEADGHVEDVLGWTYPEPIRDVESIAGRIAFFDERVDVTVDGEPQERPQTPWSSPDWIKRAGPP